MSDMVKVAARALGLSEDATAATVFAEVDRMVSLRRDRLVDGAVADGRLVAASRYGWRAALDARGVAAEKELAALTPVPRVAAAVVDDSLPDEVYRSMGVDPAKSKARRSA